MGLELSRRWLFWNKMGKVEKEILEGLNKKQVEAVTWGEGPLLIIAGAGTGKTKVITHRIAWLIVEKKAMPEEILGLTFTDKAADEMESRVDILVPYGWAPVEISTFHSFGQRILREYAFEIGISPDFKVLSEPELLVFLKERLFELPLRYFRPLSHPTKYLQALLDIISRAKDEDVSSLEYMEYAKLKHENASSDEEREEASKQLEIAECYERYEEFLRESEYVDMPGLIALPLNLLRRRKSILKKLQQKYKYILVDEFQDTNYAQFQLLKLLAARHRNLTVVGDDDQSIYKFRGACLANILSFKQMYPDAHTIVLTQNYRSTQAVLDSARRLIVFNNPDRLEVKAGVDKVLKSEVSPETSSGQKLEVRQLGLFEKGVEYRHYDNVGNEADSVAQFIEKKRKAGYKYSDFAVLVRTNQMADSFLRAFNLKGIPWTFSGNQGLYDRDEVQVLMSLLRVLRDVDDTQSLYRVINSPAYKVNPLDLSRCLGIAYRSKKSLYEVLKAESQKPEALIVSESGRAGINSFLKDIDYFMKLSTTKSAGRVVYEFLSWTGWLKELASNPSIENELRIKNIAEFLNIVEKVRGIIHTDKVPFVIEHIESLMELGENPPVAGADFDVDAVHVLTVHKAKGLEFRVVFLVGLVADSFPHRRMPTLVELPLDLVKEPLPDLSESEVRIQEERRLFYVGMTRAKEELILTSARDYGGKRERKPSQFIIEALDLSKEEIVARKAGHLERIEHFGGEEVKGVKRLEGGKMLNLTSTGIDDWLTCPRKYWYIHWLKVPTPKYHTIVYGGAVHKAIESYLSAKIAGRGLSFEEVLKVFKDSWVSEGFISRKHEEERFRAGEESLRKFFEQEEKDGIVPTLVEEPFSFVLENIKVIGRWDRVDLEIPKFELRMTNSVEETQDARRKTQDAVIIDYKTGGVDSLEKAERRVRESVQLPIYAFAYRERFGELPSRVEFYFVDTGIRAELKGMGEKVEKVRETIKEVAQGVRALNFEPRPKYLACDFCPCRVICGYSKT